MMNLANVRNRWQAFGIHLALSLIIFLVLLAFIVFVWYPGIFINMGGYQGIRIVAGVDLVLGPLLTLVIFNRKKPAKMIKMDFAIIGFAQVAALSVGTFLVYNERPMAQVLSDDALYIHTLSEFKNVKADRSVLNSVNGPYPKKVFVELPEDSYQRTKLKMDNVLQSLVPFTLLTERYIALEQVDQVQLMKRLSIHDISEEEGCYWMPVKTIHSSGDICFHPKEGTVLFRQ